jgi:hypothetical protein
MKEIQKVMVAILNSMLENDFWKCFDSCKHSAGMYWTVLDV